MREWGGDWIFLKRCGMMLKELNIYNKRKEGYENAKKYNTFCLDANGDYPSKF